MAVSKIKKRWFLPVAVIGMIFLHSVGKSVGHVVYAERVGQHPVFALDIHIGSLFALSLNIHLGSAADDRTVADNRC